MPTRRATWRATSTSPQALREATGSAGHGGAACAAGAATARAAGARADADLRYAMPSQTNLDRNTVDMDRERASFADNAVKYEATLRFINGSVRTMLDAMKSQQPGLRSSHDHVPASSTSPAARSARRASA